MLSCNFHFWVPRQFEIYTEQVFLIRTVQFGPDLSTLIKRFSLIVVALCAVQNSSHLVTTTIGKQIGNGRPPCYWSFAYSALACFRTGISGSASFP